MSRPLLLFMPLYAMYVGGCYMLKQHTWRTEAGVVDGSLSGRSCLTSRPRTTDEAFRADSSGLASVGYPSLAWSVVVASLYRHQSRMTSEAGKGICPTVRANGHVQSYGR